MIRYFIAILAATAALILPSEAVNDSTFLDYLGRTSLKVEDCVSRDPSELFLVVAEREKLGYSGTPSHEETVIEAFYQNYTKVLKAHNDSKHVEVAKARSPTPVLTPTSSTLSRGLPTAAFLESRSLPIYPLRMWLTMCAPLVCFDSLATEQLFLPQIGTVFRQM
ncbi:MAG: hypothetical protein K8R87_03150 [Verrucomicrobia bacterium]|nr:hypothetical protein [Verrucomicrobiota bacterium]